MKRTLLLMLLAGSILACGKENKQTETPVGSSDVTITIQQDPTSKGISNEKGNNEYAVIGSGKLYFLDNSYASIYQRQLTTDEINVLANTAGTTTSGNSITITGVPSSAKYLYFMANIKTDPAQPFETVEGTTSSDARLRLDRLQGDTKNVPMSGLSGAFVVSSTNPLSYTASVTITPIVARMEISKVTCENANSGVPISTDITGYKLSGIFINNINTYVLLGATPYPNSLVNIVDQPGWQSGWSAYFTSNINFPYFNGGNPSNPTDWTANSFVNYCSPTSSGLSFYPDETLGATTINPGITPKKAWAYQVSPTTSPAGGQTTPVADIPHIILKLTDVTYVANPLGGTTQYVTISKYQDVSGNPVLDFKRGNVYRIENLKFNHTQATNRPYDKNISVTATVSVNSWVINPINPMW